MKNTLLTLAAILIAATASAQTYSITGSIEGAADGDTVFLEKVMVSKPVAFAIVKDGKFSFTGNADPHSYYYLKYTKDRWRGAGLVLLEEGDMKATATFGSSIRVTGTPANDAHRRYIAMSDSLEREKRKAEAVAKSLPKPVDDDLAREPERLRKELEQLTFDVARRNINNPLGRYLLGLYADTIEPEQWDLLYDMAPDFCRNDHSVKSYKQYRDGLRNTAVGRQFAELEMFSPKGKKVKLSDFVKRNKLTLVDVWISWCCSQRTDEIQTLKDTYDKYHRQGLEIVGVALDEKADDWKKAIADYGLSWQHMAGLAEFKNQCMQRYGLTSFPYLILIDQSGKVVARDFRYDDIPREVEKAFASYRLSGCMEGLADGDSIWIQKASEPEPVAKAVAKKGKFRLTGNIDPRAYHFINCQLNGRKAAGVVFLDRGDISVSAENGSLKCEGTPLNDACRNYFRQLDSLFFARKTPMLLMSSKDKTEAERNEYAKETSRINREINQLTCQTVKANLDNGLGLYLMALYADRMTARQWDELMATAPDFYLADNQVANLKQSRDAARRTAVGKRYADFEMQTPDGSKVRLSDYVKRNRLTLVDLWVGWVCGERKPEIDILKKAYADYHDKGLEIVGVSFDTDGDTWRKAIADNGLTWPQMCDFRGSKSGIFTSWGFDSFPNTCLINQDGYVVARGFRDGDIIKEVEKALSATFSVGGCGFADGDTVTLASAGTKGDAVSTVVSGGSFRLTARCDSTNFCYLNVYKADGDRRSSTGTVIFPEPGNLTVTVGPDNSLSANGSPLNDAYTLYRSRINALGRKADSLRSGMEKADKAARSRMSADIGKCRLAMGKLADDAARVNMGNLLGMYVMGTESSRMSPDLWDELVRQAPDYYLNHKSLAAYAKQRAAVHNTAEGKQFIDFEMLTPDGKEVRLSDHVRKNRVTMLDFWASWCGPCCAEIPAMKKALELYGDKGFDIVGVSLDSKADAWKKAIEKHQITWPQMSDLRGFESEGAQLYGVTAIPATYLIDQNGTIVATNVRGEGIARKVGEILRGEK